MIQRGTLAGHEALLIPMPISVRFSPRDAVQRGIVTSRSLHGPYLYLLTYAELTDLFYNSQSTSSRSSEDCTWLHKIPTRKDHVDSGMDVFGRERFEEHRQDHGGVGSMRSDSKTLYVGRIHIDHEMEATVQKHFQQWGEIERVKILREKGVAFVTYQGRLNAEFAKEAMANQSLDHGEV